MITLPPPPPVDVRAGRRWPLVAAIVAGAAIVGAAVWLIVSVASSGGAPSLRTFADHGVKFTYPEVLTRSEVEQSSASFDRFLGTAEWHVALVRDRDNVVVVAEVRLPFITDDSNADAVVQQSVARVPSDTTLSDGPDPIDVGRLDGYRVVWRSHAPEGHAVTSEVTEMFEGTSWYVVKCQYTTALADEMRRTCQRILDSLEITTARADAAHGWTELGSASDFRVTVPPGWRERRRTASSLVASGEAFGRPIIRMYVEHRPTTGSFIGSVNSDIARATSQGLEWLSRSRLMLPAGPCVLARFTAERGRVDVTAYYVDAGSDFYVIAFVSRSADRTLLAATRAAVARSLSPA
jgi:hypothetical protein